MPSIAPSPSLQSLLLGMCVCFSPAGHSVQKPSPWFEHAPSMEKVRSSALGATCWKTGHNPTSRRIGRMQPADNMRLPWGVRVQWSHPISVPAPANGGVWPWPGNHATHVPCSGGTRELFALFFRPVLCLHWNSTHQSHTYGAEQRLLKAGGKISAPGRKERYAEKWPPIWISGQQYSKGWCGYGWDNYLRKQSPHADDYNVNDNNADDDDVGRPLFLQNYLVFLYLRRFYGLKYSLFIKRCFSYFYFYF